MFLHVGLFKYLRNARIFNNRGRGIASGWNKTFLQITISHVHLRNRLHATNFSAFRSIWLAENTLLSRSGGVGGVINPASEAASITSASAGFQPLLLKHAASPTVDYFIIQNSTNGAVLALDQNNALILQRSFGSGFKFDPVAMTIAANGNNTNQQIDLLSKGSSAVRVNAVNSTGTGGFAVYDGAATPKLMFSVTNAGLGNNGAAFKHGRVSTGSVGAAASAAVTLTWTTAFADTNYTVNCSVQEAAASTSTLRVHHIESVAAGSVVVRVVNDDGANPKTGTLHCTAVHD